MPQVCVENTHGANGIVPTISAIGGGGILLVRSGRIHLDLAFAADSVIVSVAERTDLSQREVRRLVRVIMRMPRR